MGYSDGHKQENRRRILQWESSHVPQSGKDSNSEKNDSQGQEFEVECYMPNLKFRLPTTSSRMCLVSRPGAGFSSEEEGSLHSVSTCYVPGRRQVPCTQHLI